MTVSRGKLMILVAAAASFMCGMLWSGRTTIDGTLISTAEARIGRPLTPMSYAGVARRTTRRALFMVEPRRSGRRCLCAHAGLPAGGGRIRPSSYTLLTRSDRH